MSDNDLSDIRNKEQQKQRTVAAKRMSFHKVTAYTAWYGTKVKNAVIPTHIQVFTSKYTQVDKR